MIAPLLAGLAVLTAAPSGPPSAAPSSARPVRSCIQVGAGADTQYYPVDDHTIIIESQRRWYKLTVSPSGMMNQPGSFFINQIRGSSSLCSTSTCPWPARRREASGSR